MRIPGGITEVIRSAILRPCSVQQPFGGCHRQNAIVCIFSPFRKERKILSLDVVKFVDTAHDVTDNTS